MLESYFQAYLKYLALKLKRAGMSSREATGFVKIQYIVGIGSICLALCLTLVSLPSVLIVSAPSIVFLFPYMRLNSRIRKRQNLIRKALPFYLDLLSLILQAGLDLIAGIEEILSKDHIHPLKEELTLTLNEIRMGKSRSEAFSALAQRTDINALALLATAIHQSQVLGVSLCDTIQEISDSIRQESFRDAELRTQKAPLKLLIPLIGLIFPIVFLTLLAPIAFRFYM